MTSPSVLSVGQCGFDHTRISRHFEQSFGARVLGVATFDEALAALRREHFDLVLVNRVNDSDDAPGVDLIRSVKAEVGLAGVPMMLVSNFPEAQQEAEALGALPGFGKGDLATATTRSRLEVVLRPSASPGPGGTRTGPAMRNVSWIVAAWLLATFGARGGAGSDGPAATGQAEAEARSRELFRQRVEPMLRVKCLGCHGDGEELDGELDLRNREGMLRGGKSGPALVPGRALASLIYQAVRRTDERVMPPKERPQLEPEEIAALKTWIEAGAPFAPESPNTGNP